MYDYDAQIKRLTANPTHILGSWGSCEGIFKMISNKQDARAGCLTMIRNNANRVGKPFVAVIKDVIDMELTESIQNDERIPKSAEAITPAHLPIFKEWQERIDKLQNN